MIVGVPKESYPGERRVALVPVVVPNLVKAGLEVIVEAGAGEQAGYPDAIYVEKGAKIVPDRAAVFGAADIVVQVLCYGSNDVTGKADLPLMRRGQTLIGFCGPSALQKLFGRSRRPALPLFPWNSCRAPRALRAWTRFPPWPPAAATRQCCSPPKLRREFFP